MAIKVSDLSLLLLVAASMPWNVVQAQSGCTMALMSLSPCLSYVGGNSSSPPSSCCSQLGSVVKSQPQCLCALLNGGGSSLGLTINTTRALALPGSCNVQTPPISLCDAVNGPAAAAAPAPADSPTSEASQGPTSAFDSDVPSVTGSKTVPGHEDGPSAGGSSRGAAFSFIAAFLLIAASTSWSLSVTGF